MEIGFTSECEDHAKRMHDEFWILQQDSAKRFKDGDVQEEVTVVPIQLKSKCKNRLITYEDCRRKIHQRDGRINQAILNDNEFDMLFLKVPKNPVGLGAMYQDMKILGGYCLVYDICT